MSPPWPSGTPLPRRRLLATLAGAVTTLGLAACGVAVTTNRGTTSSGTIIALWSQSKHVNEAWTLLKYCVDQGRLAGLEERLAPPVLFGGATRCATLLSFLCQDGNGATTMAVDRSYTARNDASRAHLETIVARLEDAALQQPVDEGWTVAATLAHLAFYDRYAVASLAEWAQHGVTPPFGRPDAINAAELPTWRALPGQVAATMALEAARAVDQQAAAAPDALVQAIVAAGRERLLDRSIHRRAHLEQLAPLLERGQDGRDPPGAA